MKNLIYLCIALASVACSTKHDVSVFNGYWKLQKVCQSGEVISSNNGLVRIENDTLFNFPLGDFNYGNCYVQSTSHSCTLSRICGVSNT